LSWARVWLISIDKRVKKNIHLKMMWKPVFTVHSHRNKKCTYIHKFKSFSRSSLCMYSVLADALNKRQRCMKNCINYYSIDKHLTPLRIALPSGKKRLLQFACDVNVSRFFKWKIKLRTYCVQDMMPQILWSVHARPCVQYFIIHYRMNP